MYNNLSNVFHLFIYFGRGVELEMFRLQRMEKQSHPMYENIVTSVQVFLIFMQLCELMEI